jgi:hypothetical protein
MKQTMTILALCLALAGCKASAQVGAHTATIEAPASVNRGEKLIFRVTLKDGAGNLAAGVVYQWKVSWDGVEGIYHKGKAGEEQRINVKGAPGPASLRVYAYDAGGNLAEIAKHDFKVD